MKREDEILEQDKVPSEDTHGNKGTVRTLLHALLIAAIELVVDGIP